MSSKKWPKKVFRKFGNSLLPLGHYRCLLAVFSGFAYQFFLIFCTMIQNGNAQYVTEPKKKILKFVKIAREAKNYKKNKKRIFLTIKRIVFIFTNFSLYFLTIFAIFPTFISSNLNYQVHVFSFISITFISIGRLKSWSLNYKKTYRSIQHVACQSLKGLKESEVCN